MIFFLVKCRTTIRLIQIRRVREVKLKVRIWLNCKLYVSLQSWTNFISPSSCFSVLKLWSHKHVVYRFIQRLCCTHLSKLTCKLVVMTVTSNVDKNLTSSKFTSIKCNLRSSSLGLNCFLTSAYSVKLRGPKTCSSELQSAIKVPHKCS